MGLLITSARKICSGNNYVKAGKWKKNSWPLFLGEDLKEQMPDEEHAELAEAMSIKNYNEDVKDIIKKLINNYYPLNSHMELMNETDRTSVGLLFNENMKYILKKVKK